MLQCTARQSGGRFRQHAKYTRGFRTDGRLATCPPRHRYDNARVPPKTLSAFAMQYTHVSVDLQLYQNQNQNNLYSTHVVAVNKILLYSFKYGNSI